MNEFAKSRSDFVCERDRVGQLSARELWVSMYAGGCDYLNKLAKSGPDSVHKGDGIGSSAREHGVGMYR